MGELDPEELLRELGWGELEIERRILSGMDAQLWRVRAGEARFALRVLRADQRPVAQREALAMRIAVQAGFPAPVLVREGLFRERPVQLLSWCPGETVGEVLNRESGLGPDLAQLLGETLADLHGIAPPVGLERLSVSQSGWLGCDHAGLREALLALPAGPEQMLHLDFHPFNVLVTREASAGGGMAREAAGWRVSGVIDWTNVAVGDARFDLARSVAIVEVAPIDPALPMAEPGLRAEFARRCLGAYSRRWGEVRDFELFLAWAGLGMRADLAGKIGRAGIGLTERDLEPIDGWVQRHLGLAGLVHGER